MPRGKWWAKRCGDWEPVKITECTDGAPCKTVPNCGARRGSHTMTETSAWLMMCRIWSFINCLFSGVKTAPLQAEPNMTSRCSAQFHIKLPTGNAKVIV